MTKFVAVGKLPLICSDPPFCDYKKGELYNEVLPFRAFVYGAPNSGKTTIVRTMLSTKGEFCSFDFDKCCYFRTCKDTTNDIPGVDYYDYRALTSIAMDELAAQYQKDRLHRVFVFDDVPNDASYENVIMEMFRNGRPNGISCVLCSQVFNTPFTLTCRRMSNVFICARNVSQKNFRTITGSPDAPPRDTETSFYNSDSNCCYTSQTDSVRDRQTFDVV